ncbi:hypothetical protein ACOMHN_047488 [Nucella lapillus]
MNAYEFYLSTCKYVLLADPSNKSTWVDLYGYLPCLRQMLSCCVCGNIMLKPKGPSHAICLHHVCSSCIGGKMRLRPACSWCRTHDGFTENPSMRILILCFKKMCEYINSTAIGREIRKAATNGAHTNTLIRVLDEAAAFEDDYVISNKVMPTCVPTWGMAPEPKLVSLPRGPSQPSTSGSSTVGRKRSDSAASASSQSQPQAEKDNPPKLTSVQTVTKAVDKEKPAPSNGPLKLSRLDDELDLMPALLAPCTQKIIPHEKLSPPLAGPQRADVLDQQGPGPWDKASSGKRGRKMREKRISKQLGVTLLSPKKVVQTLPPKAKLKNSMVLQTKLRIKGKYQKKQKPFKQEIDFEPPCKRTRLASSLNSTENLTAAPARKVCKCARLNLPSRFTCFNQRCACYSHRLPCNNCSCRGCCNPLKTAAVPRNAHDKSDVEHDPTMPVLSPEPSS